MTDLGSATFDVETDLGSATFDVETDLGSATFGTTTDLGTTTAEGLENSSSELTQYSGITSFYWSGNDLSSLADDDPITSWEDQHSGLVVSEVTSAQNPLKKTLAGQSTSYWDGLDDVLRAASGMDLTGGATVFAVTHPLGPKGSGDRFGGTFIVDAASGVDGRISNYPDRINSRWTLTTNLHTSNSQIYINSMDFDATAMWTFEAEAALADCDAWENRTGKTVLRAGDTTFLPDDAGSRFSIGVGYGEQSFYGHILGLAIYAAVLTPTQRTQVWDDLESALGGPW